MRHGRFDVELVSDRAFRMDGGSMFGVVPKRLWERAKPADEGNRIEMITHNLLVRFDDRVVLVDTGIGELSARVAELYALDPGTPGLLEGLAARDVGVDDVTDVVLTHLHFDHCGWSTRLDGEAWVPTFGRATTWIEEGELEVARTPTHRRSYQPDTFEPVVATGRVELWSGRREIVPGLEVVTVPGHTRHMAIVLIDGGDDGTLALFTDLCPTAAHVPITWVMSYDLYPVETMANKAVWLERAADERWLCVFQHDPATPIGRLAVDRPGRYRVDPA